MSNDGSLKSLAKTEGTVDLPDTSSRDPIKTGCRQCDLRKLDLRTRERALRYVVTRSVEEAAVCALHKRPNTKEQGKASAEEAAEDCGEMRVKQVYRTNERRMAVCS